MIKIIDLNKYYQVGNQKYHVLKNINLAIDDGDFLAVRGRSGAGKSTLLHILGGLDNFDSGSYFFNETEVNRLNDSNLARLRNNNIGFVLQDFSLINNKSVLFNVMLPLFFSKSPYSSFRAKAKIALESVGISDQANKVANQLSGGQRQRVAIARAIINNPSVILADEPTGALDTETSKQIMDLLKNLNSCGITVIIVTHDEFVAGYCNSEMEIQDGEIKKK